ncbi:dTMP kinase [Propionicimonas sp.]|uniref:dTMP kinase n=1 Tax=Propionicimonas sp. TaxID=1955623 RepID=UPI00179D4A8B|nr:dTMP kinase [Propionicimonas sp.]MBU3975532.1 dTMP kinase [Actinomycetota bacterium]MBA3020063.1 dTMP kinase [Propionicimonas sp.]MBU3986319.1 dTMP kinase [Actinomycetota bacterium]MBU4007888.1 dTMP kinase [Actinomycetota bacterium]MBU4064146.1 dTMP kinase [Actinomycetota bacterium]
MSLTQPAEGIFVVFEGGDGVGKSTQTRLLADWLTQQGREVVVTLEPGGTELGSVLRDLVLNPKWGDVSPRAEALMYAADKAQHLYEVVLPALRRGAVVISDRYVDSMLAYQGAGRDLDADRVEQIARWATKDLLPDLTVLLDLDPELGVASIAQKDRLEGAGQQLHHRARQFFLDLAQRDPQHYLVLAARDPIEQIAAAVRGRLSSLLSAP